MDRYILAVAPPLDFMPVDIRKELLEPTPCLVTSWCFERVKEWKGQIKERRRIAEIALRIALIQSACNGEKEVSHESLELALKFGEGQEDIRKVYKAGLSQNPEAECTEAILSVLMQHGVGAKVHWTTMINNKSWYRRFGASMVKRVRDSLEKEGIITVIKEAALDMNGNEVGRPKPTGEVKLQRPIK